mmetsp:Transcript_34666/g.89910  ORF Transcript_34666/g.89910 Transcript_34666/m.89910 type:complete len:98 (+) Transcript_34666:1797-2090(+)
MGASAAPRSSPTTEMDSFSSPSPTFSHFSRCSMRSRNTCELMIEGGWFVMKLMTLCSVSKKTKGGSSCKRLLLFYFKFWKELRQLQLQMALPEFRNL